MKKYARRGMSMQARRIVAGLLCLAVLGGLLPALTVGVEAVTWAEESEDYLRKIVDWGIMRGDQEGNLNPEREITRAEFASMINRAYGYSKPGPTPFTDVPDNAWYAHDVATAYNVGYMKGISETEAGPGMMLTREQAVTIIGRNMMFTPAEGEVLAFSDGRDFSEWSGGWIQACADAGVALGYEDGTFQPRRNITRGEVAAMLVRAIGSLVKDEGENILGQVYGNVIVNTSGVTLKDTVVAGDLYLTGGIDLGSVMLDNVNILGRIIVSGAGEGNQATSSVTLRNTMADTMLVDSIADQFVSIRAQGNTLVERTIVRSDAYLEDQTGQNWGMKLISLSGDPGLSVQLAGNIKDVTNQTPVSLLTVARGSADRVSVDEEAVNSRVQILNGARVKNLELDVGTSVTGNNMGTGDIDSLKVYSSGSVVEQLPNTIDVRPGVTANVNGTEMDTGLAAESSQDPRLLAGYPKAQNVAPTSAEAVFSTNKPGTVYWALTAVADGSVSKQELLKPSSYSRKIISSGTVNVSASKTENVVKLPKLTMDGSYYISAIMVDNRGQESPVKVTAFTTPDNTVPAFASGYPKMEQITNTSGQVMLMPTKTCQLYYAIMPKGSAAPTLDNFRTGSLSGNLGYGVRNVTKNTIDMFNVNSVSLNELTDYDVYLCLYDADGGQTSGVKKLTFKTKDGTPPIVTNLSATAQAKAVRLSVTMNEKGKFWYVVVERGARFPEPVPGQMGTPSLNSEAAKTAVKAQGKSASASANRAFTVNLSGLQSNTAYDLYYLAEDDAGNSREVVKYPIETLDTEAPRVSLEFTSTDDEAGRRPNAGTGLRVVFSERVKAYEDNIPFLEKYTAMANETDAEKKSDLKEEWGKLVQSHITLMQGESRANNEIEVPAVTRLSSSTAGNVAYNRPSTGAWVNYEEVTLKEEGGNLVFIFGDGTRNTTKAVQLVSGGKYHVKITDVRDLANKAIDEKKPYEPYRMPDFSITIAEVGLDSRDPAALPDAPSGSDAYVRPDMWFQVLPDVNSKVNEDVYFDVLLWSETNFNFTLYGRVLDKNGRPVTNDGSFPLVNRGTGDTADYGSGWVKIGDQYMRPGSSTKAGRSITSLGGGGADARALTMTELKAFFDSGYTYEFAVQRIGTRDDFETWGDLIKLDVQVVAGSRSDLQNLANSVSESSPYLTRVDDIGQPKDFSVEHQFENLKAPEFNTSFPTFELGLDGDKEVDISVNLTPSEGDVYFVVATPTDWIPRGENNISIPATGEHAPPESGGDWTSCPALAFPAVEDVLPNWVRGQPQWSFSTDDIKSGYISVSSGRASTTVKGLKPSTTYFVYFVIQSKTDSSVTSRVLCYQFTTKPERKPVITPTFEGSGTGTYRDYQIVNLKTETSSNLSWVMVNPGSETLPSYLNEPFEEHVVKPDDVKAFSAGDYKDEWGRDGDANSFSVLDALLVGVDLVRGSLFDIYAESDIRDKVRTYLTQQSGGEGRVEWGRLTFTPKNDTIDPQPARVANSKLPSASQLFCLAVAETSTGVLAFRGIENIRAQNREVPDISAVSLGVISSKTVTTANSQTNYYSCRVTLNFDSNLYYTADTGGASKYLYYNADVNITEKIASDVSGGLSSSKIEVVSFGSGRVSRTVTLQFTDVVDGASVTLFQDGLITNYYGDGFGGHGTKLTIRFNQNIWSDAFGNYIEHPHFAVEWIGSAHDGERYDRNGLIDEGKLPKPAETTSVTVEHYIMDTNGKYLAPDRTETVSRTVGESVTLASLRNGALETEGITYDSTTTEENGETVEISKGMTVKIYYLRREYTVTLELDGGTLPGGGPSSLKVFYGVTITLPTPLKDGYTFDGWYNGWTKFGDTMTVTGDITLNAQWTANPGAGGSETDPGTGGGAETDPSDTDAGDGSETNPPDTGTP